MLCVSAPNTPKDQNDSKYEHGVSCHQCFDKTSDYDRADLERDKKQIKLARDRGESTCLAMMGMNLMDILGPDVSQSNCFTNVSRASVFALIPILS